MISNNASPATNNQLFNTELSTDKLRWNCPENIFNFQTTDELEPLNTIIGQPRALESIRLGAELQSKGYNIFISGLSGTGRLTTAKMLLEKATNTCPLTYDYCYVNNFKDPDSPSLIKLPRSKGREFAKAMDECISFLKQRLPKMFEDEEFLSKRKKVIEEFQKKERDYLQEFDERIKPYNFIRGQIESEQGLIQPEVFPIINEKPIHINGLAELVDNGTITAEKSQEIYEQYKIFRNELFELARKGMKLMLEFKTTLAKVDKEGATFIISSAFEEIKHRFENEKINIYFDDVYKYILDNLNIFVQLNLPNEQPQEEDPETKDVDKFYVFKVNVILDNSNTDCAPVVIETTPSYTNLFGTIERSYDPRGFWKTDFTKIKAGSLLKADQGFLIVNALDLFSEPGVWQALKRVLLYDKLEIQPYEALFQLSQLHLKPEAIEVNVKVIIIGGSTLYRLLYHYEKGFKKIFKVNAQFDYETERNEEMLSYYPRFIAKICHEENLPHFTTDGVAAVVEWAVQHSGSQKRISLKFSDVADIIRESAFYDRHSSRSFITRDIVDKAIEMRRMRNDMIDEKMKNYIIDGVVLIDTQGARVGQINGLTVIDLGTLSFGKPTRITSTISAGTSGIINIEREVEMSGPIHNKGVLILSGILRERFASKKPLALTASIAFEQSYSDIDGDSASAAEVYAILSALSEVPIKQNLAITGSINQKGDIQPIGGVNEKITGFFEICKERGFTGDQGVIIPIQNVEDLMLDKEIVDAVEKGLFHIYTNSKLEEGAEILMGLKAGIKDKNGKYPKNTLFRKVDDRLEELRKASKDIEPTKKTKKKSKKNKI